jgi:hypothetical protein
LTPYQRKSWYIEEKHLQKAFGITTLDEEAMRMLKESRTGKKIIKDCYNYEILTNQKYADAF